jgi:hypothetical protein
MGRFVGTTAVGTKAVGTRVGNGEDFEEHATVIKRNKRITTLYIFHLTEIDFPYVFVIENCSNIFFKMIYLPHEISILFARSIAVFLPAS